MPSRTARRVEWIGLALVAAVALALLAVPLLVRSSAVLRRVEREVLPRASRELGRDIQVGGVAVRLFPSVRVVLHDVRVAGGPGEPPLAVIREAAIEPRLWPLVRSFGEDLEISAVRLNAVELTVIKRPDGTWSTSELGSAESSGSSGTWVLSQLQIRELDVRLVDLTEGGGELRVPGISLDASAIAYGRPLTALLQVPLGGAPNNLHGEIRLAELPRSFSQLGPGHWPALGGRVTASALPLAMIRSFLPSGISDLFTSGSVAFDAQLGTNGQGQWTASGPVRFRQLALRGEKTASGSAQLSAAIPPWAPQAFALDVTGIALRGPGADLAGTARVRGSPVAVQFDLSAGQVDLDALLAALPHPQAAAAPPDAPAPILSDTARAGLRAATARGTLRAKKIVRGPLAATDFVAQLALSDGVLRAESATAGFFGGTVDLGGTSLDVRPAEPRWSLRAALQRVNLGEAFDAVSGARPAGGRVDAKLSLEGAGKDWGRLRRDLSGQGELALADGELAGADLARELAGPVGQALGSAAGGALARAGAGTPLRDAQASFRVKGGALELTRPLSFQSRFGSASLGGRIGLDLSLDLDGTAQLSPEFVSQVSGGQLRPASPVPVPLHVGGTLRAPRVGTGSPAQLGASLLRGQVGKSLEDALRAQGRRVPLLRGR